MGAEGAWGGSVGLDSAGSRWRVLRWESGMLRVLLEGA